MKTLLENLPSEIKKLDRWVVAPANVKRPMCVFDNYPASTTDPNTWGSFSELTQHLNNDCYAGFVFSDCDDIIGIDFDHVIESGAIRQDVLDVVNEIGSYTEYSKSGEGLHIIMRGQLPFDGRQNLKGVEIYNTARFFVLTGNLVREDLKTIKEDNGAIKKLISTYFEGYSEDTEYIGSNTRRKSKEGKRRQVLWEQYWALPNETFPTRPVMADVSQGGRHMAILSIAGQWINADITGYPLLKKVEDINNRYCNPPLPHREIVQILRSLLK